MAIFDVSALGNGYPEGYVHHFANSSIKLIKFSHNFDERGEFSRLFDVKILTDAAPNFKIISQVSISKSLCSGTFRGVHVQSKPSIEIKCVRILSGSIIDYAIDLNLKSVNFGKMMEFKITEKDEWGILIPAGYGHAIFTTSNNTTVAYAMNSNFIKERDVSINYLDPLLGIELPSELKVISKKDLNAKYLEQLNVDIGFS